MSTAQRLKGIATIYSQVVKSLLSAGVKYNTSNIKYIKRQPEVNTRVARNNNLR